MYIIRPTAEDRDRTFNYVTKFGGSFHLAPVVDALNHGVNVFILPPKAHAGMPGRLYRRPFIGLIGDDLLFAEGPAGFHLSTLRKLFACAHAVYIMSGSANRSAYAAAADGARAGLRTLIIETQDSEAASWMDYAKRHAAKAAKIAVTDAE